LLGDLRCLIEESEEGVGLFLYCIPLTNSRIDAYEIQDLKLLLSLFGKEVVSNLVIVFTQGSALVETVRQERENSYMVGLP